MNMLTLFKNNLNVFDVMRNSALLLLFILSHQMATAQQDKANFNKKFKFKTGFGITDIRNLNGLAMQNELEMDLKKWLSVSAVVQISKRGNNASLYQTLRYLTHDPDKFQSTFISSNRSSVHVNNFSSVGAYLFLYPFGQGSFRFRFGPGISYNSFEKITVGFYKEFDEVEIYNHYLRVRNAKKADVGLVFGFEKDLSERIFIGLNFNGYLAIEEASSFFGVVGFRIN